MNPTRNKRLIRMADRLQREWDANPLPTIKRRAAVQRQADAAIVALARRMGALAGYSRTTSSRPMRAKA